MERPSRNFQLLVFLLLPLFFAASVRGQSTALRQDPTLRPILEAEHEGRLVDAEKLLQAAIQDAETQSAASPRLHLLLNHLAAIDVRMGRPADAIAAAKRLVDMDEKLYGAEGPNVARDLSNLGTFYQTAGDEAAAGQALERALAVARKNPGEELLLVIGNLAPYYSTHHRTADAKLLLNEALEFCDAHPGPHVPACSDFRARLANIYRREGHPGYAEEIVSSAAGQTVGTVPDWFTQVNALNALAQQYEQDESYGLAETTYRQAIALIEKTPQFKEDPGASAFEFLLLGKMFEEEGLSVQAEDAYKRALDSEEASAGPGRPARHAESLLGLLVPLAGLYRKEGRVSDLEPILQQALALQERDLGRDHVAIADTLLELASVYQDEGKYPDAAPLYQRALEIQEKNLGPDSPRLLTTLDGYAAVLRQLGDPDKARAVTARASTLRQKLDQQTAKPRHKTRVAPWRGFPLRSVLRRWNVCSREIVFAGFGGQR
jgi:tetratricopeptide (TPR) repeat protein